MQQSTSPTRTEFPLSTKKVIKKTLLGGSGWAGLGLIFMVTFGALSSSFGVVLFVLCLTLGIVALVYLYELWYFNYYFYDLTNDYVTIRKNPITPKEINVPYERIQDVYVDQDLFDRIFGLYDVHISSATISSGFEAHIDGVEKQAADGLRAKLLQKVQEKIRNAKGPTV